MHAARTSGNREPSTPSGTTVRDGLAMELAKQQQQALADAQSHTLNQVITIDGTTAAANSCNDTSQQNKKRAGDGHRRARAHPGPIKRGVEWLGSRKKRWRALTVRRRTQKAATMTNEEAVSVSERRQWSTDGWDVGTLTSPPISNPKAALLLARLQNTAAVNTAVIRRALYAEISGLLPAMLDSRECRAAAKRSPGYIKHRSSVAELEAAVTYFSGGADDDLPPAASTCTPLLPPARRGAAAPTTAVPTFATPGETVRASGSFRQHLITRLSALGMGEAAHVYIISITRTHTHTYTHTRTPLRALPL